MQSPSIPNGERAGWVRRIIDAPEAVFESIDKAVVVAIGDALAAGPPIPKTLEEAKAQVPGLVKWTQYKKAAKRESREVTVIDYLRDEKQGLGLWATREPGLPRRNLRIIDSYFYNVEFYNWLKDNTLPSDIFLPTKSQTARADLTESDITNARRINSLVGRINRDKRQV